MMVEASRPTTPPPPKDNSLRERARAAGTLLLAFLNNPMALQLYRDLEECRVQAKAAGVEQAFEDFWEYEMERAKELPGHALTPKHVLQLALKLDRKREGDAR